MNGLNGIGRLKQTIVLDECWVVSKNCSMSQDRIPKWISIVGGIICLMGLFVGCSLYLSPGTFIKDVDFSSGGTRYLANMWGARQIAMAAIIGLSILRRSAPMLQVSLLAYCLMNVQDAVIGIIRGDQGLIIGATVVTVLTGHMAFRLSKS